jgi:hypothetical protein
VEPLFGLVRRVDFGNRDYTCLTSTSSFRDPCRLQRFVRRCGLSKKDQHSSMRLDFRCLPRCPIAEYVSTLKFIHASSRYRVDSGTSVRLNLFEETATANPRTSLYAIDAANAGTHQCERGPNKQHDQRQEQSNE